MTVTAAGLMQPSHVSTVNGHFQENQGFLGRPIVKTTDYSLRRREASRHASGGRSLLMERTRRYPVPIGSHIPFQNYSPYNTYPTASRESPTCNIDARDLFNSHQKPSQYGNTSEQMQANLNISAGSANPSGFWQQLDMSSGLNPFSKTFVPASQTDQSLELPSYEMFPSNNKKPIMLDYIQSLQTTHEDRQASDPVQTDTVDMSDIAFSIERNLRVSPSVELQSSWPDQGYIVGSGSDMSSSRTAETDSDSADDDVDLSHPNKYPVEIEYHANKHCCYRRQASRSGEKIKQRVVSIHNPQTLQPETDIQQVKYYQKHLVRICRCGQYSQMDGALQHGRTNDCNGYEIHYSQKCRWKAYDDFKTGKRVLIRLCKCYKPQI